MFITTGTNMEATLSLCQSIASNKHISATFHFFGLEPAEILLVQSHVLYIESFQENTLLAKPSSSSSSSQSSPPQSKRVVANPWFFKHRLLSAEGRWVWFKYMSILLNETDGLESTTPTFMDKPVIAAIYLGERDVPECEKSVYLQYVSSNNQQRLLQLYQTLASIHITTLEQALDLSVVIARMKGIGVVMQSMIVGLFCELLDRIHEIRQWNCALHQSIAVINRM